MIKEPNTPLRWVIFVDDFSNAKVSRAEHLLESDHDLVQKVTIRFKFHTSNNQVEIETYFSKLLISFKMGEEEVVIKSDSIWSHQRYEGNLR